MANYARAFISYATPDQVFASELHACLRDLGVDAYFDRERIKLGDNIVRHLNAALEQAATAFVIWSEHSQKARWMAAEVDALTERRLLGKVAVIPVRLDDTPIPPLLSSSHWISASDHDALRVAKAIAGAMGDQSIAPVAATQPASRSIKVELKAITDGQLLLLAAKIHEAAADIAGEEMPSVVHLGIGAGVRLTVRVNFDAVNNRDAMQSLIGAVTWVRAAEAGLKDIEDGMQLDLQRAFFLEPMKRRQEETLAAARKELRERSTMFIDAVSRFERIEQQQAGVK